MLHIELAHPHQPANRSEAGACWERPGYKYNVTTTAFVCAAERHKACGEETEEEETRGTRDTEHERKTENKDQTISENLFHISQY